MIQLNVSRRETCPWNIYSSDLRSRDDDTL